MAKKTGKKASESRVNWRSAFKPLRRIAWRGVRVAAILFLALAFVVVAYRAINPPITHTIWSEQRRLGEVQRQWVSLEEIPPVLVRSVVAAEDANFCTHWGFDMDAIRAALRDGARRGGSTLTQQTVKNVFLWQDRSWLRKAIEAFITPMVEAAWPKDRIIEVYLNVAEFDEGVFGVEAAAWHYFRKMPADLTSKQAARLAVVLPNPKGRNAADLPDHLLRRVLRVMDGAATIQADGRASCLGG